MIKLLSKLSKKEFILIGICFILIYSGVWLELKMPEYMSNITKLVQEEGSIMRNILVQGGYMLLCALGSLVAAIIVGYLSSYVAASFAMKIRKLVFDKVESFSVQDIRKFSISSLITRTTNDITQVQMILAMGLPLIVKSPIMALMAIGKIVNKSWEWSAITAIAVLVLLTVITIMVIIVLPKFKLIQKYIDNINEITRENLTGIRIVRAFNAEKYQESKFDRANKTLTKTQLFAQKNMAILQPMMFLIMYLLTLAIYFVGAYIIDAANMANKISLFGDMIVFSSYAMQVVFSVLMLAIIFIMYPRASVSAKRIKEVLNEKNKIKDGKISESNGISGTVEFKNVSFRYPDAEEYLIKDISFKVEKGETVAFIGSTGSGKSTLVNLIPRFYDVTDGEILVDGINVKAYKQEFLNNKIGYVPQKAVMFSGSVAYNVAYGDSGQGEEKEEVIKKAIEIAQAKDFVEAMKDGYDGHIAQSGTNISGGQKQRLAIARVIARNPEIYIFDDTFSALDYKTDSLLRGKLKEYTKDATTLIVAQRIGTIMNADKIIVLDKGECVGIGTHKELLKTNSIYKQIALSQLSKEELENE